MSKKESARFTKIPSLADQKGAALILALGLLVVMSVLGVLALGTTSTELSITGNYRASQEAFHAADRAVEYAKSINEPCPIELTDGEIDAQSPHEENIAAGTGGSGLREGAYNKVIDLKLPSNAPPRGSGNAAEGPNSQGRYYLVGVTGEGPRDTTTSIEYMFYKQ